MAEHHVAQSVALWSQAVQTWMEAWAAATNPARGGDAVPADPFQLWRRAVDQYLAGWSTWLEERLQTPEAIAASGRLLDTILNIEKPAREQTGAAMQYLLEFFNLPTRNDLVRVAMSLNDANARLDELHVLVEELSDQVAALSARLNAPEGARAAAPAVTGGDA